MQIAAPHQILQQMVVDHPEHVLIEFTDDRAYSAQELLNAANGVAAGLQRAGIGPGERVALMIGNRFEFLSWWLGSAIAGAVSVPLNTAMLGSVLDHMIRSSDPRLIVVEKEYFGAASETVGRLNSTAEILTLSSGVEEGSEATFLDSVGIPEPVPVHRSDFSSIMFTSGTTGPSKGVMWSHGMSMAMAESAISVMGHKSEDVIFTCLPLFHANGLCTSFLPALLRRARLVVAPRFSVTTFWDMIRTSEATVTNMLGSMAALLWKREPDEKEREHRLRKALVIPPPAGYVEEFEDRFKLECTQLYGLTDIGIPIGVLDGQRRLESCGQSLPGWECAIVDDWDDPVPDGTPGELVVRPLAANSTQLGYYEMPDATLKMWRNLWLHTGDRLWRDADGWYYFVDRTKDAIRRSGENISSYEVEQVVMSHQSVEDVAAFGVPAELGEDEVMVTVVLRPEFSGLDPQDIVDWCRSKLPYFAVPRYVDIIDSLPRTATAKVQKGKLRERGISGTTYDAGRVRKPSRRF